MADFPVFTAARKRDALCRSMGCAEVAQNALSMSENIHLFRVTALTDEGHKLLKDAQAAVRAYFSYLADETGL